MLTQSPQADSTGAISNASESTPTPETLATDSAATPLIHRPRRLRRNATLRRMVRETVLTVDDLIYPVFVMEGEGLQEEVPSMPGCFRYSLDLLLNEVKSAYELGIGAIALFPLIPHNQKDNAGTESYNLDGLVPRAIRAIKQAIPHCWLLPMWPSIPTVVRDTMAL